MILPHRNGGKRAEWTKMEDLKKMETGALKELGLRLAFQLSLLEDEKTRARSEAVDAEIMERLKKDNPYKTETIAK